MPKKAFFNLPPEIREDILRKSIQLYADTPFERITLQKLLDTLSLHPTTFYRYFEDKDELYFYIHTILEEKLENYYSRNNPEYEFDPFEFHEGLGPITDVEERFVNTFSQLPREVLLRGYWDVFKADLFKRYRAALRKLRAEGRLCSDIDEDLISYMYATTMFNFSLFCREFNIQDWKVIGNLKKNFYMNFFRRGLLKDPEEARDE